MQIPKSHRNWFLRRTCSDISCSHRRQIGSTDLFATAVPGPHGGTRQVPAFRCARCGTVNALSISIVPRALFDALLHQANSPSPEPSTELLNWFTGREAFERLSSDLAASKESRKISAFTENEKGELVSETITPLTDRHILEELDRKNIQLLVVEHTRPPGRPTRTVYHPRAGAAICSDPRIPAATLIEMASRHCASREGPINRNSEQ